MSATGWVSGSVAKWSRFDGGTFAAAGKYGYTTATKHGTYHIWPISWPNGRHKGYSLMFANQPANGGVYLALGLWVDLGMFSHPHKAAVAARSHHCSIEYRLGIGELSTEAPVLS